LLQRNLTQLLIAPILLTASMIEATTEEVLALAVAVVTLPSQHLETSTEAVQPLSLRVAAMVAKITALIKDKTVRNKVEIIRTMLKAKKEARKKKDM
jgi:hypothetical protein